MSGKIRGTTLLTSAVLAVLLGLWYASLGCAEAETGDVVPACSATGGCGDRCVDRRRGEQCDDGNRMSGDGCSADCQLESAPDGGDTTPPADDAGDTTPPRDDADTTPPRDDGGGTDTGSCPESPCRLRPSCGCPAGQKCRVVFSLLPATLEKECGTAGSGTAGDLCTGDEECTAGTVCSVLYSEDAASTTAMCGDYCNGDSDCSGVGSICYPMLSSGDYPGSCTHACDLVTNAGCPSGTGCKALVMTLGTTEKPMTDCGADVGSGSQGSYCTDDSGCRAGTFCADTDGDTVGNQCFTFCKVASPACPSSLLCNSFDTPMYYGTTEYGYCY